ncbi:ABC transporter ATP-binding protein [Persicirhabdus sediminis]|uniref:ABC transporter ATP-binding protein n=1 Tax=Persicirhabdus sediminis TaxID=454144 RepID=A0A8J7MFF9_9BACT|nr:ABC transporter ATP-binding protein [Persicirhabdus sediminis]MBK1791723.1 ABC transporter ATP-binding protein [Persicirhabdus sediminis]
MNAISVKNLHRNFAALKAVDGISFDVPAGSVCGFVGANGAGKTTTMRILATLDYPDEGEVRICDIDIMDRPDEVRKKLGWMPDDIGNYSNMTVWEYLDFYARALGYKGEERQERLNEVMDFTDLHTLVDRDSDKLSKGMTQRLCLARALLQDPEVLIMDEPAAGLDPKARVELKHLIRLLADEGKTILISSHILSELGEMCDHLLFINSGKIVHHGDSDSLKNHNNKDAGLLYDVQILGDPQSLCDWAATSPYVELIESRKHGGRIKVEGDDKALAARVLANMLRDGLEVTEFHREQRNLEDAFIDMLGSLEEANANPIPPALPNS